MQKSRQEMTCFQPSSLRLKQTGTKGFNREHRTITDLCYDATDLCYACIPLDTSIMFYIIEGSGDDSGLIFSLHEKFHQIEYFGQHSDLYVISENVIITALNNQNMNLPGPFSLNSKYS